VLKYNIWILTLTILSGCQNKTKNQDYHNNYDIQISYNYHKYTETYGRDYMDKKYLRDGKLYLIFESNFSNDTVEIMVNNKPRFKDVISTDQSTGTAKDYIFDDIHSIETLGLRVNNGKQALLEIDTMNFFLVEFRDTILKIRVPKNVPIYE
jgi:hypothetical protein